MGINLVYVHHGLGSVQEASHACRAPRPFNCVHILVEFVDAQLDVLGREWAIFQVERLADSARNV